MADTCLSAAPAGCQPLGLSELVHYLAHRPGQLSLTGCLVLGRGCPVGPLAQPQLTGHTSQVAGARQGSALPLGAGCSTGLGSASLCRMDAALMCVYEPHNSTGAWHGPVLVVQVCRMLLTSARCCCCIAGAKFPASRHLPSNRRYFSEARSACTSARGKAKHSRLLGAQAQPGWSPIPSGLKLVGPVKGSEERDRQ